MIHEAFINDALSRARQMPPFRPIAYYDEDGDCIEFIHSQESWKAVRINPVLTVYYGHESEEVVGAIIKDVQRLLNRYPGLLVEFTDARVKVSAILRAHLWRDRPDPRDLIDLKHLIEIADSATVELPQIPA